MGVELLQSKARTPGSLERGRRAERLLLVVPAGDQFDRLDTQNVAPARLVAEDAGEHRFRLDARGKEFDHAPDLVADDGVEDHRADSRALGTSRLRTFEQYPPRRTDFGMSQFGL
jgi:hypothetical protein